jgi:outer membrane receptor protein involved in Fe transport
VDPVTGDHTPSDSGPQQYVNTPESVLLAGADFELRREWRQGWMFSAYYGYQHGQYQPLPESSDALKKDPRVINAPEHLGSLRGVVPVVPELASLGARVTLEAPRRIDLGDAGLPAQERFTRTAVTADVTLSGNIRRFGVGYVLGVYNLTDQRYDYLVSQSYLGKLSRNNGRTVLFNVNVTYP